MAKGKAKRNGVVAKILADAREAAEARKIDALIARFNRGDAMTGDEAELLAMLALAEKRFGAGEVA
jgi:hypothetical protein